MSIPSSVEAVAIVVLLFIPGYIFLQFTKRAIAFIPQSVDARYFFALVAWGGLIHGVATPWTLPLIDWYQDGTLREDHSVYAIIWAISTLIVGPLVAGIVGAWFIQLDWVDRMLRSIAMDYVSRTPSAWNYATKIGPRWVRVHLKDGTIIGGTFDNGAFADDAGAKDLYLSKVYNLDANGDFADPVASTAGVWITHSEISHIMFYLPDAGKGATNDPKGSRRTDGSQVTETGT